MPQDQGKLPSHTCDPRAFRNALARFATGVAIVTAAGADGPEVGMTISSLNSVSLDPPLLLFSIARTAQSLPSLSQARTIGVNILGRHQEHLSTRFARAQTEKWSDCGWREGRHGAPLLPETIATFECAPYAQYDGGDHVIFVVRVVEFSMPDDAEPLIFFNGKYHALAARECA